MAQFGAASYNWVGYKASDKILLLYHTVQIHPPLLASYLSPDEEVEIKIL